MIDQWLQMARRGKCIPEYHISQLCQIVKERIIEEPTCQYLTAPINICGNLNGQLPDLNQIFQITGDIPDTSYLFLGDFVDKGFFSVELLQLLLCLKAKWPDKITLLRGNHESRAMSQVYGFYDEVLKKYGNTNPWKMYMDLFDYLGIAAVVENKIFGVHGGLSPTISTIDQIQTIQRGIEIPYEGSMCDLIWSDPDENEGWGLSPRGAGYIYGSDVVDQFNFLNGIELICRSCSMVLEGYKYWFKSKGLVSFCSGPNYSYRCGNAAAILRIDSNLERKFETFMQNECDPKFLIHTNKFPYFL